MWPTTLFVCTYIWHSFNSKSIFKKAGISCLNIFFFIYISLPKKSVKRIEIVWTLELLTDKISRFLSYDRPSSQNNIWTTWICDSASNGRWKGTRERDNGRVSQTSAKAPRPWQTIADLLKTDSDLWVYLTGRVTKASSRDWSVACQIQK